MKKDIYEMKMHIADMIGVIEDQEHTIGTLEDIVKDQQELMGIYINNWTAAEEELAAIKESVQ